MKTADWAWPKGGGNHTERNAGPRKCYEREMFTNWRIVTNKSIKHNIINKIVNVHLLLLLFDLIQKIVPVELQTTLCLTYLQALIGWGGMMMKWNVIMIMKWWCNDSDMEEWSDDDMMRVGWWGKWRLWTTDDERGKSGEIPTMTRDTSTCMYLIG